MDPQDTHEHSARARGGFSLVEIAVVLAIVTIAAGLLAQTLASSAKLDPVATETAIAASGARTILERIKSQPFAEIVARYNDVPGDDPGGAGTAEGAHFSIPGLAPISARDAVGTVSMPLVEGHLREDVVDSNLGMPRDLNADGLVDGADHSLDSILLPIRIRVEWASRTGKNARRSFELYTMYAKY